MKNPVSMLINELELLFLAKFKISSLWLALSKKITLKKKKKTC